MNQRNLIRNSWSNIDTELNRRYDLIPNLVETVRDYNTRVQSFPSNLIANAFDFDLTEYFQIEPALRSEAAKAPEVDYFS